jgi:putative acetyltransferase
MKIRKALLKDKEEIAAVHKASIKTLCSSCYENKIISGWVGILTPDIYDNAINEKIMIVAEQNSKITGIGILDIENREIGAVYIHPDFKGSGTGKRLLLELEKLASQKNICSIRLNSTLNAHGFYKKHGYSGESGSFHELPNGIRLECISMHKTL